MTTASMRLTHTRHRRHNRLLLRDGARVISWQLLLCDEPMLSADGLHVDRLARGRSPIFFRGSPRSSGMVYRNRELSQRVCAECILL